MAEVNNQSIDSELCGQMGSNVERYALIRLIQIHPTGTSHPPDPITTPIGTPVPRHQLIQGWGTSQSFQGFLHSYDKIQS